jgi:hypothetical protein
MPAMHEGIGAVVRALLVVGVTACGPGTGSLVRPPIDRPPPIASGNTGPPGRLRTGAGLCRVTGEPRDEHGARVSLEVDYDEAGRLATATTTIEPGTPRRPLCAVPPQVHTVRFAWTPAGRLAEVEHRLRVLPGAEPEEDCETDTDLSCFSDAAQHVVARDTFRWDESGTLAAWQQTFTDCTGTEQQAEALHWSEHAVEVTRTDPSGTATERLRLDDHGRVIASARAQHTYDELGRLVQTRRDDGTTLDWSYAVAAVGEPLVSGRAPSWQHEGDSDTTVLSRAPGTRIEIHTDRAGRPTTVQDGTMRWTLHYGACAHAERATSRWWLDRLFGAWPWPAEPTAGAGPGAVRAWTEEHLPLSAW